jgi:hypothetical protein
MSDVFARVGGLKSSHAFKAPVKVATAGPVTLAGEQTIDGVAVVEVNASLRPDRVLVKDQDDATQNGIYRVSTGPWQRDVDFDGSDDVVQGTRVYVHSGDTGVGEYLVTTADPIVIDTSEITFAATSFGSLALDRLGVGGATADDTNRLSVNSPASLFNHAGAGHQVKVNKASAGDTASFLFQTGFSGRAEIGLVGDDNFQFKVSPDGSTFYSALTIDKDDGSLGSSEIKAANVYQLSGETDKKAAVILRGADAGSHAGQQNSFVVVEHRPIGSGANGPANADYALTVSIAKNDFTAGSPTAGEIDAVSIAVRQGGTASDCSAILGNIAHAGTGFSAFAESVTSLIPGPSFAATQSVRTQIGVLDNVTSNSFGYFVSADLGTIGEAFRAGTNGGTFTWLFRGQQAGTDVFTVSGSGRTTINGSILEVKRNDIATSTQLNVEQAGSGDATMRWLLTGTRAWIAGIDNSDGDAWKLGPADDGFATAVLRVGTDGSVASLSPTAGLGYGIGAGGVVTQLTSKSTGVTLNKVTGQITMNNAALAAATAVTFTLTNSAIGANDTVTVNYAGGGTALAYQAIATEVAAGSVGIRVTNLTAGSLSEAVKLNFNIHRGSAS